MCRHARISVRTLRPGLLSGAVTLCVIAAAGSTAAASPHLYTYQIHDSRYGTIGTYSNAVDKNGDALTITTEAHISVTVLGIVLYRQDVSRTERRVGDRLVYFHGITTENGKPVEVNGRAEGDHFVIVSPSGKAVAPGTIRSANPWSIGAPGGDMIFMPDTGLVMKAQTSGGEEASIPVDGVMRHVRRHQIDTEDGSERYEVWTDDNGTPLKFTMKDQESDVTFTLVR